MDGGFFHNNPIKIAHREWKLLWGGGIYEHPDILLSLGTGFNPASDQAPTKTTQRRRRPFEEVRMLFSLVKNHFEDSLDCEKTWKDYVAPLQDAHHPHFVRFNIPLSNNPPALDDVHRMKQLQEEVRAQLYKDSTHVHRVAMQLVATSFYFETTRAQQLTENVATISGTSFMSTATPVADRE
jgi:hypothetical protein